MAREVKMKMKASDIKLKKKFKIISLHDNELSVSGIWTDEEISGLDKSTSFKRNREINSFDTEEEALSVLKRIILKEIEDNFEMTGSINKKLDEKHSSQLRMPDIPVDDYLILPFYIYEKN